MATAARKLKSAPIDDNQLQLLYGDDALTKYWSSSLFNTVYLRHDIADKHSCWKDDDNLDFQNFMNTLRNLAAEYKNREKELSNWSETETINNWVKHVLHALGWTNNCTGVQNPFLEETSFRYDGKTYRTDILIVDHPKEKQYVNQAKGDDKLKEARQSILMPVEVKYWQRLEEYRQGKKEEKGRTDNESDDLARTTTPNEQTVQYMDILKKSWGILTDGARWRLFNNELSSEDAERYYEFNFYSLFEAISTEENESDSQEIVEAAKYFYYFFSKFAFYPNTEGEKPFVDEVLQYSKKYVNKVEEDLKGRFVKAMNIACNGFYKTTKESSFNQDLSVIRNVSESALFNILFIKSLESRTVLPMISTDYKKLSLSSIIDKIERFDPEKDDLLNARELERAFKKGNGNSFLYKPDGVELHDRILRITDVIHKGTGTADNFGFEIAGFKESIFSEREWKIFKTCKISNNDWVKILFELGYAESESLNRKYQQIPYAYFTPRQLGSIYESFLEFKLDLAREDMIFEKEQWVSANLNSNKYKNSSLPKAFKDNLFFTPDNDDRKVTGSYYTPDAVVQYAVHQTLLPLLEDKSPKEIEKVKVCDPAMGSAHFLSAALNYLSRKYLEALERELRDDLSITMVEAKQKLLHSSIYGVDINPRAVKLAKMSLWLESADRGRTLEDLEDQLLCGDALVESLDGYNQNFNWKTQFKNLEFDAILGNPPWITFMGKEKVSHHYDKNYTQHLIDKYKNSTSYKLNSYAIFIERALQISKEGTTACFVVPQTILENRHNKDIRKYLLENTQNLIINVLGAGVFEGVVAESILIAFKKGSPSSDEKVKVLDFKTPEKEPIIHDYKDIQGDSEFVIKYNVSSEENKKAHQIFDNNFSVGEIFKVYVGIVTGNNKLYLSNKKENKNWEKIITGKNMKKMKCEWGSTYVLWDINKLHSNTDITAYDVPLKILVRKTGNKLIACLDDKKMLTEQTVYNLIPKEKMSKDEAQFYVAQLNTEIIENIFKSHFITNAEAYPYIKGIHLKQLPLIKYSEASADLVKLLSKYYSDAFNGIEYSKQGELNKVLKKEMDTNHKKTKIRKKAA